MKKMGISEKRRIGGGEDEHSKHLKFSETPENESVKEDESETKRHLLEASPKRLPRPINDERSTRRNDGTRLK
ncbi:hypothetical protein PIB30_038469 [Stylosanthes scabra]|uniref:Uncharacterized protein n=1 Tax=Stylosanthes scabra TaxID=79078 RepID=A0ABU6ZB08_9FABA|nr:hypothetical protein [Stylosanthes scabra]